MMRKYYNQTIIISNYIKKKGISPFVASHLNVTQRNNNNNDSNKYYHILVNNVNKINQPSLLSQKNIVEITYYSLFHLIITIP